MNGDDPRMGSLIRRVAELGDARPDAVLLGVPDDRAVVAGGGRSGAAGGPAALRERLFNLTPGARGELEGMAIVDLGDVAPAETVEETHARAESLAAAALHTGASLVLVGGGHDASCASGSALAGAVARGRVAVVNVDTHFDVRPLKDGAVITSGTPFRRLLERWGEKLSYTALGAQSHHNAASHFAWLRERKARVVWREELRDEDAVAREVRRAAKGAAALHLSVDLDAARASHAPGVSAPPADGLTAAQLGGAAHEAGVLGARVLDVMELNPALDVDGHAARLGAWVVWRFLDGLSERRSRRTSAPSRRPPSAPRASRP